MRNVYICELFEIVLSNLVLHERGIFEIICSTSSINSLALKFMIACKWRGLENWKSKRIPPVITRKAVILAEKSSDQSTDWKAHTEMIQASEVFSA